MSHVIPERSDKTPHCSVGFFGDHNASELGIGLQALHHGFKAKTQPIAFTPAQKADAESTAIDSYEVHSGGSDEDRSERVRGQSDAGVCQAAASSPAEMETGVSLRGSRLHFYRAC